VLCVVATVLSRPRGTRGQQAVRVRNRPPTPPLSKLPQGIPSGPVPGNVNGQNGWHAGASSNVVADPVDAANAVLAITTDSTHLYKALSVADNTSRMLFLRFRFADRPTYSIGMSGSSAPSQYGDFEAELSMSSVDNKLSINDTSGPGGSLALTTLAADTWYNVWMLLNNTTDDTQVYLHARAGESATAADLLSLDGQSVFGFRGDAAGELRTFFIKTAGGSSENQGPLYLDDIYLEDSDAANLQNPVPEPGAAGAVLLAMGLALRRQRGPRRPRMLQISFR